MGAKIAASNAEKKALSKGAKASNQKSSFEDLLNTLGGKKPKAKDVGSKPGGSIKLAGGGPIGLAAGVAEDIVQKVAEENQKKKEITKSLKEMKSKKNQGKYEAALKQAELEKLEAALQSSPEATQKTPVNKLKAALQSSPEATQQTPINKLKAALQSSPEAAQQTSAALKEITSKKNQEKKDSYGNGLYEAAKAYSPFALFGQQYSNPYGAAKQTTMDKNKATAYGEALKKNQLTELLAMIAQGKQKGKQG